MALPKRVKIGGAYYKGYLCSVGASTGSYTTLIVNTKGAAINSISIIPDGYGPGDTMSVEHWDDTAGTGSCKAILAENIYNMGAHASVSLDFPAAELVNNGESIKFIYVNSAGVSMNVYLIAEFIGIKKTS